MQHARYTLTLPLALNDGAPVDATTLATIEGDLLDVAGGFTATDSIGAWRAPDGAVYREPVRVYTLDVPDTRDAAERIRGIADIAAIAFDQEAIYVTRADVAPELVTPVIA
jgi:hypothetical protein